MRPIDSIPGLSRVGSASTAVEGLEGSCLRLARQPALKEVDPAHISSVAVAGNKNYMHWTLEMVRV
jgi:hypothetical protein